jgi:two-component sensor histidine kinase
MIRKAILGTLAINALSAVVATAAFTPSGARWSTVETAIRLTISLIYANCIGACVAYSLHRFSRAIGARAFPMKWALLVFAIALATVPGCLMAIAILVGIGIVDASEVWLYFSGSIRVSTIVALIFGISIFLYEGVRNRLAAAQIELQARELREERALKLAAEARLASLESRVQPHFLFNTLNSISALIREDPGRAERTVERLAALLRFSLDAHRRHTVPLAEELKIVTDYLEIERARYGERLRFALDVPVGVERVQVPPLAVQTLVENSVKHAVAPRREGGEVRVACRLAEGRVLLEVSDDGPGFVRDFDGSGGLGLETLEGRLAAIYGSAAALSVAREGGRTLVSIALPAVDAGTPALAGERRLA